jgi:hypothetical protein
VSKRYIFWVKIDQNIPKCTLNKKYFNKFFYHFLSILFLKKKDTKLPFFFNYNNNLHKFKKRQNNNLRKTQNINYIVLDF